MLQVSLGVYYSYVSVVRLSCTWAVPQLYLGACLELDRNTWHAEQDRCMCTLRYLSRCLLLWWLRSEFVCPSAERALPWPLVCIIIYLFQSIVLIETGSEGISGKISVFGKIEYYIKKKVRCFRWYRLTTSTLMRRQTGGGSGRTRNVRSLAICIYLLHSNMYLVNRPFVKASQSSR